MWAWPLVDPSGQQQTLVGEEEAEEWEGERRLQPEDSQLSATVFANSPYINGG